MADEIINTDINSADGTWGTAETIEYSPTLLGSIISDVNLGIGYLDELADYVEELSNYDSNWEGEAKLVYDDLKLILKQYQSDYRTSVDNLLTSLKGLYTLLNDISTAEKIVEIENA